MSKSVLSKICRPPNKLLDQVDLRVEDQVFSAIKRITDEQVKIVNIMILMQIDQDENFWSRQFLISERFRLHRYKKIKSKT